MKCDPCISFLLRFPPGGSSASAAGSGPVTSLSGGVVYPPRIASFSTHGTDLPTVHRFIASLHAAVLGSIEASQNGPAVGTSTHEHTSETT
ncbi:hypothetical protein B6U90_02435 [Thermoplasmatales archaeon ex4484_6]|nr:MAG: hypothetical protein B6U90_02435 [Thermoplasmatales archaeon ex4484_6]RLF68745.1 MAG: hypothetical protein DRN57_03065 [Thermoplasmata archaeon]